MELILDDDDHMQFYPALDDVEAAVLHVVSAVSGTMQNVPTVQVQLLLMMLRDCLVLQCCSRYDRGLREKKTLKGLAI